MLLLLYYFQTLNRLIRAPSVAAKEEWVEQLKDRASGSLANKKKAGEKVRREGEGGANLLLLITLFMAPLPLISLVAH